MLGSVNFIAFLDDRLVLSGCARKAALNVDEVPVYDRVIITVQTEAA